MFDFWSVMSKDACTETGIRRCFSSHLVSLGVLFLLLCVKVWLVSDQKIVALYLPYDDFLYVETAESVSQGNWMGDYNHRTLTKVPGYAIWIALMDKVGIPLLFSQHMVYLAAVSLIAILLMFAWIMIPFRKGTNRTWWIGFLFFGCAYLAIAVAAVPVIVAELSVFRLHEMSFVIGILMFATELLSM